MLSFHTFLEDIKSIVTEIHEFKCLDSSLLRELFLGNSEYQDSVAKVKIIKFFIKSTLTSAQRSIKTLMREINHVFTKKNEFE